MDEKKFEKSHAVQVDNLEFTSKVRRFKFNNPPNKQREYLNFEGPGTRTGVPTSTIILFQLNNYSIIDFNPNINTS